MTTDSELADYFLAEYLDQVRAICKQTTVQDSKNRLWEYAKEIIHPSMHRNVIEEMGDDLNAYIRANGVSVVYNLKYQVDMLANNLRALFDGELPSKYGNIHFKR